MKKFNPTHRLTFGCEGEILDEEVEVVGMDIFTATDRQTGCPVPSWIRGPDGSAIPNNDPRWTVGSLVPLPSRLVRIGGKTKQHEDRLRKAGARIEKGWFVLPWDKFEELNIPLYPDKGLHTSYDVFYWIK